MNYDSSDDGIDHSFNGMIVEDKSSGKKSKSRGAPMFVSAAKNTKVADKKPTGSSLEAPSKQNDSTVEQKFKKIVKENTSLNIKPSTNADFSDLVNTSSITRNATESHKNETELDQTTLRRKPVPSNLVIGEFEKHTKGFGAKMLAKMGFKGRLGKHEQGIAQPVAVMTRPKNAGLGTVKEATSLAQNRELERDLWGKEQDEEISDSITDDKKRKRDGALSTSWKLDSAKQRKKKKVYKTVQDIMQEANEGKLPVSNVHSAAAVIEIVDMTGPKKKIVTSYEELVSSKDESTSSSSAFNDGIVGKELVYNVRLLADMSGVELNSAVRKLTQQNDRLTGLRNSLHLLDTSVDAGDSQTRRIEEALAIIDKVSSTMKNKATQLNIKSAHLLVVIEKLQREYSVEYKEFSMVWLFSDWLPVVIRKELHSDNWMAFDEPKVLSQILNPWYKTLVETPKNIPELRCGGDGAIAGYAIFQNIMDKIVMPTLQSIFLQIWNPPSQYKSAITIISQVIQIYRKLGNIQPSMSSSNISDSSKHSNNNNNNNNNKIILQDFLYSVVLTKIEASLRDWDPLDNVSNVYSVDHWVLKWVECLGESMLTGLYPRIRQGFIRSLRETQWNAGDYTVLQCIGPWREAMDKMSYNSMIKTSILPVLIDSIQSLDLNYSFIPTTTTTTTTSTSGSSAVVRYQYNIELDAWFSFLKWSEYISYDMSMSLLRGEFCEKWLSSLEKWLIAVQPDGLEIIQWYIQWKCVIPPSLLNSYPIENMFKEALDIVNVYISTTAMSPYKKLSDAILNKHKQRCCIGYTAALEMHQKSKRLHSMNASSFYENASDTVKNKSFGNQTKRNGVKRDLNLKEVVEMVASKHGLLFLPLKGKVDNGGKQVYSFNNVNVILDKESVWKKEKENSHSHKGKWVPVKLSSLLSGKLK